MKSHVSETLPPPEPKIKGLHMQDLRICGFRGIEALYIQRLGRITLLIGDNAVGKTTVLEAVDTYAARGRHPDLGAFLARRGEFIDQRDEGENDAVRVFDYAALFHGRGADGYPVISICSTRTCEDIEADREDLISIGPIEEEDTLEIRAFPSKDWSMDDRARLEPHLERAPGSLGNLQPNAIEVSFRDDRRILPNTSTVASKFASWRLTPEKDEPQSIECLFRQPGLPNNDVLVSLWDRVALTDGERYPLEALRLITRAMREQPILPGIDVTQDEDPDVEGITIIGDHHQSRRLFVKIRGQQRIPLASLGDGALRAFGTMLALVCSRNGVLLIDEVDNGIDEALHPEYWLMLFDAACEYNVQIIATTHGLNCMKGFARMAKVERVNGEALIVELKPSIDGVDALEYDDWNLYELTGEGDEPNY